MHATESVDQGWELMRRDFAAILLKEWKPCAGGWVGNKATNVPRFPETSQ